MCSGSRPACGGQMRDKRDRSASPASLPWLARWLPRQAREEWFAPALTDLRADAQRRRLASDVPRSGLRSFLSYRLAVAWLFVETIGLVAQDAARGLVHRDPRRDQASRKDWLSM